MTVKVGVDLALAREGMGQWKDLLKGFGSRADAEEPFYNERLEVEGPVLLNQIDALSAAFVGARVVRAVARRKGSRLHEGAAKSVERLVARGLSEEARHHCEAEAERILRWLEAPPAPEEPQPLPASLAVMVDADLASRRSVASFAKEHGYALELEYYDEAADHWPRLRAMVLAIDDEEPHELRLRPLGEADGRSLSIALRYIRWLMPVAAPDDVVGEDESGGEVIEFPGTWSDSQK